MIKIRNADFAKLAERIKKENSRVVIYGAGLIGKILIPYVVRTFTLYNFIECYVDADSRLVGEPVLIDSRSYVIRGLTFLDKMKKDDILLITNSKFYEVIDFLDSIPSLNDVTAYIVPVMQLESISQMDSIIELNTIGAVQIPKVINYCWFGKNEMPDFLKRCILSWEKHCPDYRIQRWDESNYDVGKHIYTKQAYEKKRYGFITDLARLDILYENGGFYFDTDVELVKNLDDYLFQEGFVATEKWGNINSGGGCGFVKAHPMVKKLLEYKEQQTFIYPDGSLNISTNGVSETKIFSDEGYIPNGKLQNISGINVYPPLINHPYDYMSGKLQKSDSTMSIHHFYGGWMDEDDRKNRAETQANYQAIISRIEV